MIKSIFKTGRPMTKKKMDIYLERIEESQDNFTVIEEEIWKKFGVNKVVMVCDSTNFSQKTKNYGIVHFLYLFDKMVKLTAPIIKKNHGHLLKTSADNLLVIFKDMRSAANCAIEIQKKIMIYNLDANKKNRFGFCMGLASGRVLNYNNDVFGDTVNVASKLGEDLAKDGEILIEEQIYEFLKTYLGYKFSKKIRKTISSIEVNYFKIKY